MLECNVINKSDSVFTKYMVENDVSENRYVLFINHVKMDV